MDILGSDVEHGCGRCRVNVVAGLERPDQARILRKVSDASQLDLVVVGDQELVPSLRQRPFETRPRSERTGMLCRLG